MPVSRVTVPAEFYDITSSLMLKQPTPEFFFAKMAIAAQVRDAIRLIFPEAVTLVSEARQGLS